uniref:glucuronosyltransferase n=1 Tax=Acrobeloides nanus TaxID=290746 RepID=A0A914CR79_9BILA
MYLPEFINNDGNGTKLAKVIVRPRDFPVKTSFSNLQSNIWEAKEQDIFQAWKVASFIGNARSTICKHQLQDQAMMNHLRAEKFDIALGEYTCFYGLLEHIGIDKYITVFNTALLGGSMLGIPSTPSFVPNYVANEFPNSYLSRAKNLISTILSDMRLYGPFLSPIENVCKDLVRPDFDIKEQIGKSAFFLVNVDEFTDFPRPISHKIVYIGGMGQAKPKPLEPDIETGF